MEVKITGWSLFLLLSASVLYLVTRKQGSVLWLCVMSNAGVIDYLVLLFGSILDMQQKQAIPFQGGAALDDFDGRLFVASVREVYALVPVPFEKQVCVCVCVCGAVSCITDGDGDDDGDCDDGDKNDCCSSGWSSGSDDDVIIFIIDHDDNDSKEMERYNS